MKINVYSIVWNAEVLLPYFLRHYSQFADRIFIVDDHSTDKTAKIAKSHPMVTYIPYGFDGLNEDEFNDTFYSLYKENPSDWAMCVDQDEFVYKPRLEGLEGVLATRGYTMVSNHLPTTLNQIYDELKMGFRTPSWDKPIIFDPKLDVKFGDGRHTVNLPATQTNIKLLHYKYLSVDNYLEHNLVGYRRIAGMGAEERAYRIERGLSNFEKKLVKVI